MRSPNDVKHPIHELMKNRWSPRAFDSARPVETEKLFSLLEAARWTASCNNAQPWSFIIAQRSDAAAYEQMLHCLVEKNQSWAKTAPLLLIAVAANTFPQNSKPNNNGGYDTGAAMANLTLEAMAQGLYVHQMAGFDATKTREVYAIPDNNAPMAAAAIGYLGDPAELSEDLRQRELTPSTRKSINEFTFAGKWGQVASVISTTT